MKFVYIDRTLRMHASDADIFSKLTISKLKVKIANWKCMQVNI